MPEHVKPLPLVPAPLPGDPCYGTVRDHGGAFAVELPAAEA